MKRSRRIRIGLFGGSFDPVHIGHILLARWARKALALDEVWLVPQALSADGKRLAPAMERLKKLQRAVRGERGLSACDVDLRLGGVSRTVDTLRTLRGELGPGVQFTWLLGQDQVLRLPTWKEAGSLPALCRFSYFGRPGSSPVPETIQRRFRCTEALIPSIEISSSWIRQQRQGRTVVDLAETAY